MTTLHVLHGDGNSQTREAVRTSLSLDGFSVVSCSSGAAVATMATDLAPDLILCDVVMPGLEGAALLRRLQDDVITASIPVIMTAACARPSGVAYLKSLGATAVIAKPFDYPQLAQTIRSHLLTSRLAMASGSFSRRLCADATALATFRDTLWCGHEAPAALGELLSRVHKLAGAAGVFGFLDVSLTASALEETIIDSRAGRGGAGAVKADLEALLTCIERVSVSEPAYGQEV